MSRAVNALLLMVAAGLVLILLEPGKPSQALGNAAPKPAMAAVIRPAPAGTRIWYGARNYPHLTLPDGRQEIVRSVLNIQKPMQFGAYVWDEDRIPKGPIWVRVDLGRQLLSVFRGGHEIGSAVILYGTDGKPTPTGSFTVLQKAARYVSHSYDAPMPYMLRLTDDGVAIHGSNVRQGWATHGCIGVPLDFARLLFAQTNKGDVVVILPASAKAGKT
jgi:lipoprotein-anchoring transpeptidase ErfK/SrfK